MQVHSSDSPSEPNLNESTAQVFKLTFDDRQGYLYALIQSETMTREIAVDYLGKIADRCAEVSCDRIMLERDVRVMLPDSDLFFATTFFLDRIKETRVAFVNPHDVIGEDMDFAVMIGTNRGANYKLFNDVIAAEKWLLSDK